MTKIQRAGGRLREELSSQGIGLGCVGVAGDALHVYLHRKKDVSRVPMVFEGYLVRTSVTGPILPART